MAPARTQPFIPPAKRPSINLDEITPGLFLGNIESILDEPTVRENNIKAAISVTSRDYVQWHEPQFIEMFPHHIWIQAEDDSKQELLRYMSQCCDFIDENLKPTSTSSPEDPSVGESGSKPEVSKVLVHCRMGISRSATIIIAYLMRKKRLSAEDALAYVRVNRWIANPNANFMAQLKIWEDVQYEIWEDKDKKIPKPAYQKYLEEKQFKLEVKCCENCRKLARVAIMIQNRDAGKLAREWHFGVDRATGKNWCNTEQVRGEKGGEQVSGECRQELVTGKPGISTASEQVEDPDPPPLFHLRPIW